MSPSALAPLPTTQSTRRSAAKLFRLDDPGHLTFLNPTFPVFCVPPPDPIPSPVRFIVAPVPSNSTQPYTVILPILIVAPEAALNVIGVWVQRTSLRPIAVGSDTPASFVAL
jgi:hypothetical protein